MLGLNIRFEIERRNDDPDDSVGGSVPTGTVVFSNLRGRIEGSLVNDELMSMSPGLQTVDYFRVTMQPGNQDIRPFDIFRITSPTNHPYFNEDMQVVKRVFSNFVPNDPRDYMILDLTRSQEARRIQ